MAKREHLLTLVEPTKGGDATLDLAHDTVERGGDATVVMVVTDRVRRDIDAYASSENLDRADAEGRALNQLDNYCRTRVGGSTNVVTRYSSPRTNVAELVTPEITAIAVPEGLIGQRAIGKLVKRTGLPVVVTPAQADTTPDVAA
ncbi:MAG: hypothetical protein OES24_16680 [Acidimicrobiia bacterium]|nr:hypothetical protein [Acidimicrobiia bacterium]